MLTFKLLNIIREIYHVIINNLILSAGRLIIKNEPQGIGLSNKNCSDV